MNEITHDDLGGAAAELAAEMTAARGCLVTATDVMHMTREIAGPDAGGSEMELGGAMAQLVREVRADVADGWSTGAGHQPGVPAALSAVDLAGRESVFADPFAAPGQATAWHGAAERARRAEAAWRDAMGQAHEAEAARLAELSASGDTQAHRLSLAARTGGRVSHVPIVPGTGDREAPGGADPEPHVQARLADIVDRHAEIFRRRPARAADRRGRPRLPHEDYAEHREPDATGMHPDVVQDMLNRHRDGKSGHYDEISAMFGREAPRTAGRPGRDPAVARRAGHGAVVAPARRA